MLKLICMNNWSTDLSRLNKDKKAKEIWRLEQLINFGLDGGKLNAKLLRKYWDRLSIDQGKRRYLEGLLWP